MAKWYVHQLNPSISPCAWLCGHTSWCQMSSTLFLFLSSLLLRAKCTDSSSVFVFFFFIAPNTEPQMTERLSRGMHYARSCQGSFCWISWVRTLIDSLIISLNLGTVYCIRCFRRSFYFNVSATQNHILHLLPWSSSKYNRLDNIHHFP